MGGPPGYGPLLGAKLGETVLEVGFGTGHALVELARAVTGSGRVIGVDISSKMRERALARVERYRVADGVELRTADAVSLPLE